MPDIYGAAPMGRPFPFPYFQSTFLPTPLLMKQVLAIIYLPVASRSVHRVRDFRRCEEHGNVLCYEGRALGVEEFNRVAPKVLGVSAVTNYGSQPLVKLIEIETVPEVVAMVADPAGVPVPPPVPVAKPEPVIDLLKCGVEPIADGFMLVNYSAPEAEYMGQAKTWENDASLIVPFASETDARNACPGVLVCKPEPVTEPKFDPETAPLSEEAQGSPVDEAVPPAAGEQTGGTVPSVPPATKAKAAKSATKAKAAKADNTPA